MPCPTPDELSRVPIFRELDAVALADVASRLAVREYAPGEMVAHEGETLSLFNIILSGSIQWFWTDDTGRQLKLTPEGPGGHFADTTLGGEPVLMSIAAMEPLRVAQISMDELRPLLLQHPSVAVGLLLDVVARLRRMTHATRTLGMDEVYTRVVKLLLARAVPAGDRREAALTQAEIGERVGATREMVGKILRDLARGGYIEMGRGRIALLRQLPKRW
jgi:CRP/FNR family cyclic AMP-dependent transcriptional regulator